MRYFNGNMQPEIDLDAEIDPRLFLKCRLCIVENGSYQIHQSVQQQIQYCFDITVTHFDRLSQLICRKCKGVLKEYSETKSRFLDNQKLLHLKLNAPKTEETAIQEDNGNEQLNVSGNIDLVLSDSTKPKTDVTQILPDTEHNSWKLCFDKKYVCRFCKLHFSTRERIRRHYKTHSKLLSACNKKIKKHCQIMLDKWDERTNFTGGSEAVVLSADRVIVDEGKINYYVVYQPKCGKNELDGNKTKENGSSKRILDDSSTDEENLAFVSRKKKKRLRLSSRTSSNETVVIDGNKSVAEAVEDEADIINYGTESQAKSQKGLSDEHCINIDDSSNEGSDTTEQQSAQTDYTKHNLKEIQNITSMCYTKYINNCINEGQNEKSKREAHLEEFLNRKLLSIGRKVMSTQGISSPGLLKYLQHKNLTINWFPNVGAPNSHCKQANYIRIMTKLAVPANLLSGWAPVTVNEDFSETGEADGSPRRADVSNVIGAMHIPANTKVCSEIDNTYVVTINPLPAHETDSTTKNKLLNANPVANPKTLPKKTTSQESKPEIVKNPSKAINASEAICIESDEDSTTNSADLSMPMIMNTTDLSMPIIMSTTSLAEQNPHKKTDVKITNTNSGNLNNCTEKAFPRIKCKPVSELMAPSKFNGQDNNKPVMIIVPPPLKPIVNNGPQIPIAILPKLAPAPPSLPNAPTPAINFQDPNIGNDKEKVTMHSVNLPNECTSDPIEYFRRLLEMHGLVLITEQNKQLEKTFVSLVKFKLDISRQDKSVIVGLSLYARNNIFCIKLRKINGEEMDIDTLPTFWQMHILKSFEGEVSDKIMNCATRVSHALYTYAKKFVYLLKSIEYKKTNLSS